MPLAVWTLSYPVWAILSGTELVADSSAAEVGTRLLVVIFPMLFVGAIGITLRCFFPVRLRQLEPAGIGTLRRAESMAIHVVSVMVLVSWLEKWRLGLVFGLYEGLEQLTHSLWENLIGETSNVVWLALPACLLAYGVTRRCVFLLEGTLLGTAVLLYSVVSTSKGSLLQIFVCILVVVSALGLNTVRRSAMLVALVVVVGVPFAIYSYELRDKAYFAVRGLDEYDIRTVIGLLSSPSMEEVFGKRFISVVERATGYGDGLARLVEARSVDRDPIYVFGSVVEIGNLIPRFLWEDRPHLSFNHYVTGAVWGQYGLLSESPIGRVGEAFYVGGWAGLIYGAVYGVLFGLIGVAWLRLRKSVWGAAYVVSLLIVWVLPDAYLMYHLKQVVILWGVFRLGKALTAADRQAPSRVSFNLRGGPVRVG
jgi:hypothetical protein